MISWMWKGERMIYFKVDGEPVGKARPRMTRGGHAYTPKRSRDYEESIRFAFMSTTCEKMPVYPRDVSLKMSVTIAMGIPKSYSKKKREQCKLGIIQPNKKPDIDNVIKSVLDACSGYCYEDDSSVVEIHAEKIYADEPYVEIRIYPRDWGDA